jgi:hypothetical protein
VQAHLDAAHSAGAELRTARRMHRAARDAPRA